MRWRFTDRVSDFEPWQTLGALKLFSLEEYSLLERWGDFGRLPAGLSLAAACEAASWLIMASSDFTLQGLPEKIEAWSFSKPLGPGSAVKSLVRVQKRTGFLLDLQISQTSGPETAGGLISLRCLALTELDSPDDRRARWKELRR